MHHTLVALVEDKPGVLNRVASLFRRRAFNIESLTVGRTDIPGISRMTVVIDSNEVNAERVTAYLYKLVNVLSVQVKRWRYSVSTSLYPERFLLLPETHPNGTVAPLVFAGDAFGGPRVEGAVLSGLAAGEAIAAALK